MGWDIAYTVKTVHKITPEESSNYKPFHTMNNFSHLSFWGHDCPRSFLCGDSCRPLWGFTGHCGTAPTAGDGQEVRLPGDDVEHASDGDARQGAVEATQAEVDGVKGRGDAESWGTGRCQW